MATVYNDPSSPNSGPAPTTNSAEVKRADATPTSNADVTYSPATYKTSASGDTKVSGTSGADRVSTKDLLADSDHVIKLGDGNDVFIFRQDDATNPALRNAVVDMGAGDKDQIVLANEISDYQITIRDNGSIKFEYVGSSGLDNAAITFQGAELFTFRNISDDGDGKIYKSTTYTLAELQTALETAQQESSRAAFNHHDGSISA